MIFFRTFSWLALGACLLSELTGCQSTKPSATQPAGPGGTAIPAATLEHGTTLVQLTGGDLGVGGGFLIGAARDKIAGHAHEQALSSARDAEQSPALPEHVRASATADLNNDGFVTLDEVLAMARAGLSDDEIIARLRNTGYVFHITPQQGRYLTDRGVRQKVVEALGNPTLVSISPQ